MTMVRITSDANMADDSWSWAREASERQPYRKSVRDGVALSFCTGSLLQLQSLRTDGKGVLAISTKGPCIEGA